MDEETGKNWARTNRHQPTDLTQPAVSPQPGPMLEPMNRWLRRTTTPSPGSAPPACSFCQKTRSHVERLIAGPHVWICNECIGLCNKILEEERTPTR